MKPIIVPIEVVGGNVVMSMDEFKKHINDAYTQGYHDGSSDTAIWRDNPFYYMSGANPCVTDVTTRIDANTTATVPKAYLNDTTITATNGSIK